MHCRNNYRRGTPSVADDLQQCASCLVAKIQATGGLQAIWKWSTGDLQDNLHAKLQVVGMIIYR